MARPDDYLQNPSAVTAKVGDRMEFNRISRLFVRKQNLPYGTRFVLENAPGRKGRDRKPRDDMKFTLSKFRGFASDDETFHDLIHVRLVPSLKEDPGDYGLIIRVIGPHGERISNSTYRVGRMRHEWEPLPTPQEIEWEAAREYAIDEVSQLISIEQLRYGQESDEIPLRGMLRCALREWGIEDVQAALQVELQRAQRRN